MKKHEYNADMDMTFTPGHEWHADIWLPGDARITEIHLRVYSFGFPDYTYGIAWNKMQGSEGRLRIPIHAGRAEHSSAEEAVHLAVDITYYSDLP